MGASRKWDLEVVTFWGRLAHNILYSVNDYSGRTLTNRILGQNGTIYYDSFLDNNGNEQGRQTVGYYTSSMTFTGHNRTIIVDGKTEYELAYEFAPFPRFVTRGLDAETCWK
ncbi:hypothetical protein F4779DRAFT_320244 [Xylariaceae sp. FL0662B]|nr:hypothetical protein F4779DRAFT_320244 [Xylariaceae sp. FL0662B]